MQHTLLVIDMQEGAAKGRYHGEYLNAQWWERHAAVVGNIQRLSTLVPETVFVTDIRFRNKDHIKIIDPLFSLSERSRQYFKTHDSGADALAPVLDQSRKILCVGMNSEACVLRTARDLARRDFNIAVVGDSCWTAYGTKSRNNGRPTQSHNDAMYKLRRMGIEVITTDAACRTLSGPA